MSYQRYELDVRLSGIEPAIWRTIEIGGDASLAEVHLALQVAMGWENSHLHQFVAGKKRYGMMDADGADDMELEDEREYRLQDVLKRGKTLVYEYDFGDGWEHEISVKAVSTVKAPVQPRVLAGARACPPEDCGGIGGYESLLEALANPKHPEHGDMVTWSGDFEPERYDVPPGGIDLGEQMAQYGMLDEDDQAGELTDVDEIGNLVRGTGLPPQLVKQVLVLEPMQRAQLAALIAASLADELEQARSAMTQMVGVMRRGAAPARARRGKAKKAQR